MVAKEWNPPGRKYPFPFSAARFAVAILVVCSLFLASSAAADEIDLFLELYDRQAERDADDNKKRDGDRTRDNDRRRSRNDNRQRVKSENEIDDDAPARRYSEGRLIISDFGQEPPDDRDNLDAMLATQVRIHFDYRCKWGWRYDGGAKAELKNLEIFAVVRPNESWIATPEDSRLLDHEQGHFDIAQIAALSARLHLHKQWKAGKLTARADDSKAAINKLRDNIQAEMAPFYEKLKKAQKQYDEVTSHGRRFRAQRDQRRAHDEFLKQLTTAWEESEWYRERKRKTSRPVLANRSKDESDRESDDDKKDADEDDQE